MKIEAALSVRKGNIFFLHSKIYLCSCHACSIIIPPRALVNLPVRLFVADGVPGMPPGSILLKNLRNLINLCNLCEIPLKVYVRFH